MRTPLYSRVRWLLLALLALSVAACAPAGPSPVQRLGAYPGALDRPIEDKVALPGTALLDWQQQINRQYGEDVRPRSPRPDHPLLPVARRVLAELPPAIHRLASRYVVAVYLLEGDVGTGTTEAVQDAQGRWRYAYIALNLTALTRTANEWAAWRERSAYRAEPGYDLRVVLEPPEEDTRANALRFIFLHELGHALGLAQRAHGFWDARVLPAETRDSPFLRHSWQPEGGKMVSRWRGRFPVLSPLTFYAFDKPKRRLSEAEAVYRALAQTDLPSAYGAISPFEDFAESFAIYVHARLLGQPYQVDVLEGEHTRFSFRSCIADGSCPDKVRALEAVLASG